MFAVRPELNVFGLYTGLTASGYDLARIPAADPLHEAVESIKAAQWPDEVTAYFSKARSAGGGVNPYWPRAAMLLNASFYLSDGPEYCYSDLPQVLRDVERFPVGPTQKGPDTVEWVKGFPRAYGSLTHYASLSDLWNRYLQALTPHLLGFEQALSTAVTSVARATGASEEEMPSLVVVPNPLQAPQVADFVRKDSIIHVVIAEPKAPSIVHELLHNLFDPGLRSAKEAIVGYRGLLAPVLEQMLKMQYAWGDDEESWLRVFEENLMRAAAIWVEHAGGWNETGRETGLHAASEGFIYAPVLLRCLREKWQGPREMKDFIVACLEDCCSSATTWSP